MILQRLAFTADAIQYFDPQKTGRYNIRQFGTWGSGTITITESEAGFSVVAGKSANDKTEVTLERGQTIKIALTGSTNPKLTVQISLIEQYDDTARKAE